MDELGQILREARETKGLTLASVHEETRINIKFLEALEDGRYSDLPTAVHARGFLRNYARYLGLDPEPLLSRYSLSQNYRKPPVPTQATTDISVVTPLPSREDQVFYDPVNKEVTEGGNQRDPESILRLVIIIALLTTIGLIASNLVPALIGNGENNEAISESITEAVQNITNNAEPETAINSDNVAAASEIITSTSRNNFNSTGPTPTRPPLPATLETIQLRIEVTERAWMEVTIDGDIVFSGIARPDDEPYEWEAQDEAKVNTGNAIALFVTINDIPLGRLGDRGENKEEVWRTTQ